MPLRMPKEQHAVVKDCIKKMGPNRWLLGPSSSAEETTHQKLIAPGSGPLNQNPMHKITDPEGPIEFVRCWPHATWRIGE